METFEIAGTQYTPHIKMDPAAREILIEGVSRPENTVEFYTPILHWISGYVDSLQRGDGQVESTFITVDLAYFNSISAKYLVSVLLKCKQLYANGSGMFVTWLYEADDEEAKVRGEDIASIVGMDFLFKAK